MAMTFDSTGHAHGVATSSRTTGEVWITSTLPSDTLWNNMREEIAVAVLEGKSPQEMADIYVKHYKTLVLTIRAERNLP